MESSDGDLVLKARGGDAAAFEALVRRYARLVWATAAPMLRDPSWTEDIVQESFLRAWRSLRQLDDPAAFRPWLLSIARRLVFRHGTVSGREVAAELPEMEAPKTEEASSGERVQEAIRRLPERYRLPITLRYIHEMDYAGISKELQLSNGTLRGLLNRGVKLLRRDLEPYWNERKES